MPRHPEDPGLDFLHADPACPTCGRDEHNTAATEVARPVTQDPYVLHFSLIPGLVGCGLCFFSLIAATLWFAGWLVVIVVRLVRMRQTLGTGR